VDPFSLTVGALGYVGAAATISDKGIKLTQRLRHAPGVVDDIFNKSNLRRVDCSQRGHKGYTPVDLLQLRRIRPPELFESLSGTGED
jgi:hypothetical protein